MWCDGVEVQNVHSLRHAFDLCGLCIRPTPFSEELVMFTPNFCAFFKWTMSTLPFKTLKNHIYFEV